MFFSMLFQCVFDVLVPKIDFTFYIDFTSKSHRIRVKSRLASWSPTSNPGRLLTDFTLFSHRFHIARSPRFFFGFRFLAHFLVPFSYVGMERIFWLLDSAMLDADV